MPAFDHSDVRKPTFCCARSSLFYTERTWRDCKKSSTLWTSGAGASGSGLRVPPSPDRSGVAQAHADSQSRPSPRSRLRGTVNEGAWRPRGMLLTRTHVWSDTTPQSLAGPGQRHEGAYQHQQRQPCLRRDARACTTPTIGNQLMCAVWLA